MLTFRDPEVRIASDAAILWALSNDYYCFASAAIASTSYGILSGIYSTFSSNNGKFEILQNTAFMTIVLGIDKAIKGGVIDIIFPKLLGMAMGFLSGNILDAAYSHIHEISSIKGRVILTTAGLVKDYFTYEKDEVPPEAKDYAAFTLESVGFELYPQL
ncbi:hypothetical protein NF27_JF00280 [Candidatus Jidaibacter acanthamoeba]|uniref:Uncharacterized protein n=1 Tax=Candidatus Jidaibacter acanthamoebae TaxID=86105 RepID=A0A0C1QVX0_9RICK|nr:hypothetical protein [Candidatus Jidaibacter acanthamoeba]KIE04150.1 hypothetical protein NF27_JF00280 [Candidatus Jidaibacter acanthamoeba]